MKSSAPPLKQGDGSFQRASDEIAELPHLAAKDLSASRFHPMI